MLNNYFERFITTMKLSSNQWILLPWGPNFMRAYTQNLNSSRFEIITHITLSFRIIMHIHFCLCCS